MTQRLALTAVFAGAATVLRAATVLYAPLDSLDGWSVRALGAAGAGLAVGRAPAGCVELTARGGTVFLTRSLPVEQIAGSRLTIGCQARADGVVRGPQASSTAKLHLAVETPAGVRHFSARFAGTANWSPQGLTADVPKDARRAVLNLGLESCSGRALFSELIVRNNRAATQPLSIASVANAEHEQLQIGAFPKGVVQWQGIPFHILDAAVHAGGDCVRLRGINHDDWPGATTAPIPVGRSATAVYILHAAIGGRDSSETPCAIWTARMAGGYDANLSVFEGREIGAAGQAQDLENWKVAWRGQDAAGQPVTFGVTKWMFYTDTPVLSLSCRAYRGASPVVLAATVVEEPPRESDPNAPEDSETTEGGGP
jgi:hypothetical protein